MHLEKVCRLIDMGQTFTVEFHPHGDFPRDLRGRVVKRLGLQLLADGDVALQMIGGGCSMFLGLKLSNYKPLWRCWQNGTPTDAQRRETGWR